MAAAVARWNRIRAESVDRRVTAYTWSTLVGPTLRVGSRGRPVEAAQLLLRRYGLLAGSEVDGIYGDYTRQSVVRAQSAALVEMTGVVDADMWRALWWGPTGWAVDDVDELEAGGRRRGGDVTPTGQIEHSWEPTIVALNRPVRDTATATTDAIRAIRTAIA